MGDLGRAGGVTGERWCGRGRRRQLLWICCLWAALSLAACGQADGNGETAAAATLAAPVITPREADVPTLYPTFTPPPGRQTPTPEMPPTPTPGPSLDFSEITVAFRYRIPALGLDRRLEGTIGAEITVVDETRGVAAILPNQTGAMLELRQSLPELALEPLPDGCERCVAFAYELPLDGTAGEGWLQDPVMLASVENYTTLALGPHFPPGTVLGLRRSATPYDVAHSLALTADGMLWRWLATAPEVAEPATAEAVSPGLATAAAAVPLDELQAAYVVDCLGTPVETLALRPEGGDGREVRLLCPAFSLPTTLLPLYVQLDDLLEETLAGQGIPRPPLEIPLETLLEYRRDDGGRLTLLLGGAARAEDPAGEVYTETIEASRAVSLTTALRESEALAPGVDAFAAGEAANTLLVRGPQGMIEAAWDGEAPAGLDPWLAELDQLLEGMAGVAPRVTATPAATPTLTVTPTPGGG